jgi:ADP-ribose pyrophosphatase
MSSQPPAPKIIGDSIVYNGGFLTVHKRKIRVGGEIIEREVIERRDGVAIVPMDVHHNVLLIKEYNIGSNSFLYTLPGGHIDEGESQEIAAMRELREETGYRAREMIKLRYTYSHPAISTRKSYTFLAYDLTLEDPFHIKEELIEVYKFPLEKAIQLVYKDFVSDISTLGNLLMAQEKLRELNL